MRQIYKYLLESIAAGKLSSGDTVPREIELAEKFNTNRMNAQRAVNELAANNLVTRKKRFGTKVNANIDHEKLQELIKATNRSIYVLYSMTPHWVHWNESSFAVLEEMIAEEGFSVSYRNIPPRSARAEYQRLLGEISAAGASALVIFPDSEDARLLRNNADLLADFKMPVYMLNRSGEPLPLDMVSFVSMDTFGDGAKIGALLRKNNCRNVVMITKLDRFWGAKRLEGVQMGLAGGAAAPDVSFKSFTDDEKSIQQVADIIKNAPNKDVVVVAANNEYAALLLDLCANENLSAPKDFRLISFDDNPLYRSYNLTSLAVPMNEVGRIFAKLICDNSWLRDYRGKVSIKISSVLNIRKTFKPKIF